MSREKRIGQDSPIDGFFVESMFCGFELPKKKASARQWPIDSAAIPAANWRESALTRCYRNVSSPLRH